MARLVRDGAIVSSALSTTTVERETDDGRIRIRVTGVTQGVVVVRAHEKRIVVIPYHEDER